MTRHTFRAARALAVAVFLGLAGPVAAGEQHPPLPGPGLDLPVDLDASTAGLLRRLGT